MIPTDILAMKTEEEYEFRKRFDNIHKKDVRDYNLKPEPLDFTFESIGFNFDEDFSSVVTLAAEDFIDFMKTSMNIEKGEANITLKLSSDLGEYNSYKGYRIEVTDKIIISGFDERGIAQALYNLEDMLCMRRAPYIKKDTYFWKPMYAPMMVHSGYGFDMFPDSYLSRLAHEGRDAIMLFVKSYNVTTHGPLDFNDVITRAAKYGIDVYCYSNIPIEHGIYEEGAEEEYIEKYGDIFRRCPGFKGLIICPESMRIKRPEQYSVDGIPTYRPGPPDNLCYGYPDLVKMLQKIIYPLRPDADIIFWTYNFHRSPLKSRLELVENLPKGITVLATFEMGENIKLPNSLIYGADYSLSLVGPTVAFIKEAETAKKNGVKFYAMTNTAGRTWDFGTTPYLPMAQQWIRRYKEMEKTHYEYNVVGNMECHHYGYAPSFITKLSKWAFSEPRIPYDKLLKDIIRMEFGDEVDKIEKALDYFSEAIKYYTPTDADQYGAFRVGPSFPLSMDNFKQISIPFREEATCKGMSMVYPDYIDLEVGLGTTYIALRIDDEIASLNKMRDLFSKGIEILDSIENKNNELLLLTNQCRFMRCCITTGINSKLWWVKRCEVKACRDRIEIAKLMDCLDDILVNERDNAKEALIYAQRDSNLGWEPSMEYIGGVWHIEWKIREIEYMHSCELQNWKDSIKI